MSERADVQPRKTLQSEQVLTRRLPSAASVLLMTAFLLLAPVEAAASDPAEALEQHLQGKVLLLREYYAGDRLVYGRGGKLLKGGHPGRWTFDGHIEIDQIKLRGDDLQIEGIRVCVAFYRYEQSRHALRFGKVRVDIAAPRDSTTDQLRDLLMRVFFPVETDACLPAYWRPVFETPPGVPIAATAFGTLDGEPISTPARGDTTPLLANERKLLLSQTARAKHLQGTIAVYVLVDKSGAVRDVLECGRTAGHGFDQLAITMARAWRFAPFLKHGRPVAMMLLVAISFGPHRTFVSFGSPTYTPTQPALVQ